MKRLILIGCLFIGVTVMMKAAKVTVDRIDPTNWYVGMKNPQVQLMVYGKDIATVQEVTTDYPNARFPQLSLGLYEPERGESWNDETDVSSEKRKRKSEK